MKDIAKQGWLTGEPYDYCKDFMVLTPAEKREILKRAKNFLKLQRGNALLAGASVSPAEAAKQGCV
jgi:hypothetical protein